MANSKCSEINSAWPLRFLFIYLFFPTALLHEQLSYTRLCYPRNIHRIMSLFLLHNFMLFIPTVLSFWLLIYLSGTDACLIKLLDKQIIHPPTHASIHFPNHLSSKRTKLDNHNHINRQTSPHCCTLRHMHIQYYTVLKEHCDKTTVCVQVIIS